MGKQLDFMCFCGLSLSDEVPDQNTIQAFRAALIKHELLPKALKLLNIELDQDGESGTKTYSKDPNARWVKTGANKAKFGYKQHTLVDAESGFIEELEAFSNIKQLELN